MPEDLQPLIDELKAANAALTAKVAELQNRTVLTEQQIVDLKAAVAALITLGKS